jgi:hypothetical protein
MSRLRRAVVSLRHKQFLYGLTALLWLTGVIWLYFKYACKTDEWQFQTHPAQSMSLMIHGAVAMGFLVTFGSLLFHIPQGWQQKLQRPTGITLLAICVSLILTGWGLYYLGNDDQRNIVSIIHWGIGIALPVILFFHVWKIARRINKN